MRATRPTWIVAGLCCATAVLTAGPAWLLVDALRTEPWDSHTVRIRFESVHYDRAGLVFRYSVRNQTRRTARLLPEETRIRALQRPGRPVVGYANLPPLPLVLPARESQIVEIRLELPAAPLRTEGPISDEHTKRVLQNRLPEASDAPVSPLPMRGPVGAAPPPSPAPWSPGDSLNDLDGFELVNERNRVQLTFPRSW